MDWQGFTLFSFKAHTLSSLLLTMGLSLLPWHYSPCPPSLLCSQDAQPATVAGTGEARGASLPQYSLVLDGPVPGRAFSPQCSHAAFFHTSNLSQSSASAMQRSHTEVMLATQHSCYFKHICVPPTRLLQGEKARKITEWFNCASTRAFQGIWACFNLYAPVVSFTQEGGSKCGFNCAFSSAGWGCPGPLAPSWGGSKCEGPQHSAPQRCCSQKPQTSPLRQVTDWIRSPVWQLVCSAAWAHQPLCPAC